MDNIGLKLKSDLESQLNIPSHVASGIVGNLEFESGGFKQLQEKNPIVKGSRGGYGFAQWTGPRRVQFEQWSKDNGLDPASYEANKGFLIHELQNTPEKKVLASLSNTKTADEAAQVFSNEFLRPGIPHIEKRVKLAQKYEQNQENAPQSDELDQLIQSLGLSNEVSAENDELDGIIASLGIKPQVEIEDYKTGAPANVRLAVGSGLTPEERLATIKTYYPDAMPYGENNFVYTNPETGKTTIYNPQGLDWGDIPSIAREAVITTASTLGGAAGAVAGAATGGVAVPGVGAIPGAAVGATIGSAEGAFIGATGFDRLMRMTGIVEETTTPLQQLSAAGLEGALGGVSEVGGRAIGAIGKTLLGGGKKLSTQIADRFSQFDIKPKASVITGEKGVLARIEKGLEQSVGGSGRIYEQADKIVQQSNKAFSKIVNRFGPAKTQQGAGEVIVEAAVGATERFKGKSAKLYEEVFDGIGENTLVKVDNLQTLKNKILGTISDSQYLQKNYSNVLSKIDAIIADAGDSGLPFKAFRQIRTAIREDLGKTALATSSGSEDALLGNVYDALTLDMSKAAQEVSPNVANKLQEADAFYAEFMNNTAKLLDKIYKFDADERAYKYAMSGAKDGGSSLKKLRANFKQEEWDVIAATTLNKMARNNRGNFSLDTLTRNYKNLLENAPESLDALFGGAGYKGAREALDEFVLLSEKLVNVEKLANASQTAGAMNVSILFNGLGAGIGGAIGAQQGGTSGGVTGTLLGAIVLPRTAARLITNKAFVKWLAEPLASETFSITAHAAKLYAIAEKEPQIRAEIFEYAKALEQSTAIEKTEKK